MEDWRWLKEMMMSADDDDLVCNHLTRQYCMVSHRKKMLFERLHASSTVGKWTKRSLWPTFPLGFSDRRMYQPIVQCIVQLFNVLFKCSMYFSIVQCINQLLNSLVFQPHRGVRHRHFHPVPGWRNCLVCRQRCPEGLVGSGVMVVVVIRYFDGGVLMIFLQTLVEVRPTRFLGVPRVWEKIQERLLEVDVKV